MKMSSGCTRILIAAAIMGCSAMASAAPQPAPSTEQLPPPCQERLTPPPAQPPLYALSQQTTTPAETLSTVVKNIPAVEKGKKYEVRVEVREVTPAPAPNMDVPNP
ncbi:hypothetical protein [Escherichia coli]|uniref:hypothetical protein n=1 Tax=Escherichia coli TaxID=562 RepID=UPI000CF0E5AB|nr:hypothetical protein [Escherichia coli]ELJ3714853.1 hypothetical protein [Salmonella enterica]PPV52966.1 hypothetical protein C5O86_23170 [Escherichia coli]PPX49446.1 hypothetical protein C5P16_22330 [Escherichia coli]HDP7995245.1 hypothetical protein [Escherichia coli]